MPNPNIDWKECPDGANAWQLWAGSAAWLAVTVERMDVTEMFSLVTRSIECGRRMEFVGVAPLFNYAGTNAEESLTYMPPWGRADPHEVIAGLSWSQLRVLRMMSETPDQEGSALARAADCSWAELFELAKRGFADAGMERVKPRELHPVITGRGRVAVAAGLHLMPGIAR